MIIMKNPLIIALVLLSAIQVTVSRTSEELKVTLKHGGTLVGRYLNSFSGRGIKAFLGVPYARPPVGELRFKVSLAFRNFTTSIELDYICE
jgi:carboxylesterase type B